MPEEATHDPGSMDRRWIAAALGSPPLYPCHVRGFLQAMDSRSVIARENVCALWSSRAWTALHRSDQKLLEHTLRELCMDVLVLPATRVAPADRTVVVHQAYVGGEGPPRGKRGPRGHLSRGRSGLGWPGCR